MKQLQPWTDWRPKIMVPRWVIILMYGLLLIMFSTQFAHAQVCPGAATLSWTAPTQNTDGTPLIDLAGFRISYGQTQGGPYPTVHHDLASTATTHDIDELCPGDWFFVATAFNSTGEESDFSNEATKTILAPVPSPPTGLTVADLTVFTIIKQVDKLVLLPAGTVPAGTPCDETQQILGHFVVPNDAVTWFGTVEPIVVVANCG